MGFGPSFIRWVNLFYSSVQSAVNVKGHVTPFFRLTRGVSQGCPLSPLLYVLYAEVLASHIRSSSVIPGLFLPGAPIPCPLYRSMLTTRPLLSPLIVPLEGFLILIVFLNADRAHV